jgi:hypothetical protein
MWCCCVCVCVWWLSGVLHHHPATDRLAVFVCVCGASIVPSHPHPTAHPDRQTNHTPTAHTHVRNTRRGQKRIVVEAGRIAAWSIDRSISVAHTHTTRTDPPSTRSHHPTPSSPNAIADSRQTHGHQPTQEGRKEGKGKNGLLARAVRVLLPSARVGGRGAHPAARAAGRRGPRGADRLPRRV